MQIRKKDPWLEIRVSLSYKLEPSPHSAQTERLLLGNLHSSALAISQTERSRACGSYIYVR